MRTADLHRMPIRFPPRPGQSIVCAMLCQSPIYLPPVPGTCLRRPEEIWHDLPFQDGGIYEEHAERERGIYVDVTANAR